MVLNSLPPFIKMDCWIYSLSRGRVYAHHFKGGIGLALGKMEMVIWKLRIVGS